MTDDQWRLLLSVLDGELHDPLPVGFIADSPWLPTWVDCNIMDFFASEDVWFDAHLRAAQTFPQAMFLPGFWSEYGMCTEPSAYGCQCTWGEDEFPFPQPCILSHDAIDEMRQPDPRRHGLLPLVLRRLQRAQSRMAETGHKIRFAVARGPWNVASFLMGTTDFLVGFRTDPEKTELIIKKVTAFLVDWLQYQKKVFPDIEGIMILDDLIGFCGRDDVIKLGTPYMKKIFSAFDAKVRFFHNDADGVPCAPLLPEWGVNLYNFGYEHSLTQMRELTGGGVTLLGNIPPRDVLAQGKPADVERAVLKSLEPLADRRRLILSCGGGLPPFVNTENLNAFLRAAGHEVEAQACAA